MDHCPSKDWDRHCDAEELANEGIVLDEIADHLHGNECFSIYSTSGKDADLEPGGCCGISEWRIVDETIVLIVKGHKSLSAPAEWGLEMSEDREAAATDECYHLVCGSGQDGYWDGEGWIETYESEIRVEIVREPETDAEDIRATATAIEDAVRDDLADFVSECECCHEAFDRIYNEIEMEI